MQWRQGDVLIERIDDWVSDLKPTAERLLVRGEGRFHGHFIEGEVEVYENPAFEAENPISHYLRLLGPAELRHLHTESLQETGEHDTLKLAPGRYRVVRQREYNPYAKVISIIKD
jgi:hypothetical protein